MDPMQTNGIIGSPLPRVEGLAKVTGRAQYGADHILPGLAYAALVTSTIARGKVKSIDQAAARALPGVLDILTHENVSKRDVKPGKTFLDGGYSSHSVTPLITTRISFSGQIIAVVIAETPEIAEQAAEALTIVYKLEEPVAHLNDPKAKDAKPEALGETELSAGDVKAALKSSPIQIDAIYETPANHHNPMELFQATCVWHGDELTVYESTQAVRGFQHGLAKQLGISPTKVRFLSPFIGGAFGSRGELGPHTPLIALAARRLNRPVKLVATREQGFTLRTFRAETRHHIRLAATPGGLLTALDHESWELAARTDHFTVAGSDSTARLYACPNVRTRVHAVEADRQAPGFMRAPPETPYLFAMECAMDELAWKLKLDPLDLRRRNDTMVETVTNKPYTSRSLLQCIDRGAELFRWADRASQPAVMRSGDDLVGFGYATAFYPAQMAPAECRVTLTLDLKAKIEIGAHEIGTGVWTVLTQTAADLLGLPVSSVEVVIGDSSLPAAPLAAGSNSTASVCNVVALACEKIRARLARNAAVTPGSPLHRQSSERIRLEDSHAVYGNLREPLSTLVPRAFRNLPLAVRASNSPHGAPPLIGPALVRKGKPLLLGGSNLKDRMQFAFGAQFVEVRIDRTTGQVRVPRAVGVFACGRIMNRRTAHAQLQGGQIWGISSALHEATEIDIPTGRFVNQNLAEYHVPVAADIGDITTEMLDEVDTQINALGIKGVGEIGITGMNAAIANAVYHATGTRLRRLPIRPGDLALADL